MAGELKHLFSPIRINKLNLKNRAVMPPMATSYCNADSTVSDRLVAYQERRAKGGVGLIITEVCAIDLKGKGFHRELGVYNDDFIPGLKKIPQAVHKYGAKSALQLHHAGRETMKAVIGADPEAPSAIPNPIFNQPCAAMSLERVQQLVQAYADAAGRAKEAGFDAVEVHAAHGYLPGQFLSPFSNQREDAYGGSDENRARFFIEILHAIRKKVGPDFCLLVRVSASEEVKGGYGLPFMEWLAPRLVSAGADAIHVSVGVISSPGLVTVSSADMDQGFNLHRARAIKRIVRVPVIGVGRINDPRFADQAIARGDADLISFGRQHLTDPDFLKKAERGDFEDIKFCLACNNGCIERLAIEMKSVTCTINPECGLEYKGPAKKTEKPKRIFIAGAGPAGLESALVASERGHKVTVFEREKEAGGQLRSASRPPHKELYWTWVNWMMRSLQKLEVEINLGKELTEKMIASAKPDLVVLASGAQPTTPETPGIDGPNVKDARDVLLGKVEIKSPAVVLGAGYVGMETADFLIERGIKVTVVEMKTYMPVPRLTAHGYWLNYRVEKSAAVLLGAVVKRIVPNAVIYEKDGKEGRIEPVELVVTALGAASEKGMASALQKLQIPFYVVGDAKQPRRLLEAVHEAFELADKF